MQTVTIDYRTVPIQDTICECGHWHDEHNDYTECNAPDCVCGQFTFSEEASTAEAIADRGGDPTLWPVHVKIKFAEEPDAAALTRAHLEVEDTLVMMRDSRMFIIGRGNGLVIREKDGSDSSIMRMSTRDALRLGIKAYLAALKEGAHE